MAEIAPAPPASPAELLKREREIAARHMGHFPWGSVVWCFANLAC